MCVHAEQSRALGATLRLIAGLLLAATVFVALAVGTRAEADERVYRLKLSHHSPPMHHQHRVTFNEWAAELAQRSNGRLVIDLFPAEQLGKASQQYNLVRRGDVDLAFILHSMPAGRFPLIELTHLPLLFRSAEQASRVLMDLVPDYLEAEHRDVKILYLIAHSPGMIHTRSLPVRQPSDLAGLRIRHPSSVVGATLRSWGASPAGMAPGEIAHNLDKGVIHGAALPYDGVLGFRLGPYLRYTTELFSYVITFGLVMNPASYERLPPDLRALIDDTTGPEAARRVAARWDAVEAEGRQYMIDNDVEIITPTPAQRAEFERSAEDVIERHLSAVEARGLPAREFLDRVRELAARY
jgi:TRAP-type transport system periplasmic protein